MSDKECGPECVVGKLYLHVGNSGVTFKVLDTGYGPEVEVVSSAFGNLESRFRVKTNQDALRSLRDLFDAALKESYSKEYCHAAQSLEWRDTLWAQQEKCWDAETKGVVQQMCVSPDTEVFLGGSMQRVDSVGEREDQGGINEP